MDECRIMPFLCRNGRCRNTIGSFYCECADGYVLAQDAQHCRDVDECDEVNIFIIFILHLLSILSMYTI